ncbi:cytochrome C554 [Vibrio sp. 10N.286.49.C2]|uniref:c-type cytochrome n=1 Tax=unclassified Vibrio TaxID=2614977 RepID=UPI000C84D1F6|nr:MULTISPECIES: cytochrome c [unclassified Vibrio]PMH34753.1 cytochrome C554 [Vibrio sp. 10N.286.49.C2]PMH51458.1 cytochrome C554 [Vibrio sp. 10N.286.49.B1]PMH80119.1 cytochrome C554 [Vibrio sp. 10N.286.48.B7]
MRIYLAITPLLLSLTSYTAISNDISRVELGQQKSPSCVFCHVPYGKPTQLEYPNLNGQDPLYLFNAMKAYKDGERVGPLAEMMQAQLQNLSDEDLRDVAAFYSQATP